MRSLVETMLEEQNTYSQVVTFIHQWSKKIGLRSKMSTYGIHSHKIMDAIIAKKNEAESIHRYDLERNNLDTSINDFVFYDGEVVVELTAQLMMVFNFHQDEGEIEKIVIHRIGLGGYISASSVGVAHDFLKHICDDNGNQHQIQDSAKGFKINS